ncbi:MAG: twin-arginine translocase TatA/TatE family subunit [Acidobacteriota bacterium]|nr:twin-arginine translocase TatA/TatE family subunit [Acidobacteriota bacterium]
MHTSNQIRIDPSKPVPVSYCQYPKGGKMLGSIGFTELLFIFLIVVVLFGASRIPEIGRGLGSGIQNFKAAMKGGSTEDKGTSSESDTTTAH